MPAQSDRVVILPGDDGTEAWLPAEPVTVPVRAGEDTVGSARVYAEGGALMADVTLWDERMVSLDGLIRYSARGQIADQVVEQDGRVRVTRVRATALEFAGVEAEEAHE